MKTEKFHHQRALIDAAFASENFEQARALAKEYLEMAKDKKADWNYGNAIHHGHLALGRICLNEANIAEAKEHLLAAGRSPGSPQLKTFGPNMLLAKHLLEQGERGVVLEYITRCRQFWYGIFSWVKVYRWKKMIRRGEVPNFKGNLIY